MGRIWPNPRVANPRLVVERMLRLRDKLFPDDADSQFVAASGMLSLGRASEVLERFPDDRWASMQARLILGQTEAVLATPWLQRDVRAWALDMGGDLAGLAEMHGAPLASRAGALCQLGRGAEALERFAVTYPTLLHLGRAEELLARGDLGTEQANTVLTVLGRTAEAAERGAPEFKRSGGDYRAMVLLGRLPEAQRMARQSRADAAARGIGFMIAAEGGAAMPPHPDLQPVLDGDRRVVGGWFLPLVALPALEALAGDSKAAQRAIAAADGMRSVGGQRAWRVVDAIFRSRDDGPIAGLPAVVEREAWQRIAAGVRAELAGDATAAIAAYRAFRELPMHRRLLVGHAIDHEVEWFAGWRLRTLVR